MSAAITFFDRLCLSLAWLSGLIAFAVMAVTFTGVAMRYGLRSPLMGGFEMIEIGMGLIVFSALPLMVRRRGNIIVTIVIERLPPVLVRTASVFSDLVGAALVAFVSWRVWLQGERLLTYNEVTMELRVPKGLIAQSMAIFLAVTAIAFLLCAIESFRQDRSATASGGAL